jgi:6,7-dimethyl-8-ribityllumazine synthase
MPHYEGDLRATDGARFAILASRWNPRITDALVAGARKAFIDNGVIEDVVDVIRVPGAWEIPVAAARIAAARTHVAIVALGCVIRGDTRHYEQVADGCSEGLMRVALDYRLPVCNGVLAVEAHEDALKRAGGTHGNKGEEAALVAIEMAQLLEQLPGTPVIGNRESGIEGAQRP